MESIKMTEDKATALIAPVYRGFRITEQQKKKLPPLSYLGAISSSTSSSATCPHPLIH